MVVAKKNRCLALGLLEIPVGQPSAFMSLLSCSHVWSAPMDRKGMVLFVTEIIYSTLPLPILCSVKCGIGTCIVPSTFLCLG